jgi:hypothetical protein
MWNFVSILKGRAQVRSAGEQSGENSGTEERWVRGAWRKLRNLLFANYNDSGQVREDEMGCAFSINRQKKNACMILERTAEGKRPLGWLLRKRWLTYAFHKHWEIQVMSFLVEEYNKIFDHREIKNEWRITLRWSYKICENGMQKK